MHFSYEQITFFITKQTLIALHNSLKKSCNTGGFTHLNIIKSQLVQLIDFTWYTD